MEERLHLLEQVPAIIYQGGYTHHFCLEYISPQIEILTGVSPLVFLSDPGDFLQCIHPEDQHRLSRLRAESASLLSPFSMEYRIMDAHGHPTWVWDEARLAKQQDGSSILFTGIIMDINGRKQKELSRWDQQKELSRWDQLMQSLTEHLPDVVARFDRRHRHLYLNRRLDTDDFLPPEVYLGKTNREIGLPPHLADRMDQSLRKVFEDSQPSQLEFSLSTYEGIKYFESRLVPEWNAEGQIESVLSVSREITARKKLEEERLRTSKLDSLSLLAGGIAHDFNNFLTAILGQLDLAKFSLPLNDPLYQRLVEAEKASFRARDLTQKLLTFAKGGTPSKELSSLKPLIEESARFMACGSNVSCHFHLPDDLWDVEIDIGQISQVIQNLVVNAMQAMPEGGMLSIQGTNVLRQAPDPTMAPEASLEKGKWVKIVFQDQGVGISPDNLQKIFDPYFTTKATGNGLGLATCFSIIKHHGGQLTVSSIVGTGTTFVMWLPASQSVQPVVDKKEMDLCPGTGKILVMDDESSIRGLLGEMLKFCGYTVEVAKDGKETLLLYQQAQEQGEPFQAVILDLTIPGGMGGKEVMKKLLEINPNVRAIVESGYSTDSILAHYREYGFQEKIAKPFDLAQLSNIIHKVVNGKIL